MKRMIMKMNLRVMSERLKFFPTLIDQLGDEDESERERETLRERERLRELSKVLTRFERF